MARYIISDLHLSKAKIDLIEAFRCFVASLSSNDILIILGDLFDYYIGRDYEDMAQLAVRDIVHKARKRGVKTFFMRGNRDFLLSSADAHFFGMELLKDVHIIQSTSGPVLLLHGDLLCSADKKYQRFRRITHNKLVQSMFLALPITIRRKIGAKLRSKSIASYKYKKDVSIYGVQKATLEKYVKATKVSNIIHGHIHVFGKYSKEVNDLNARICLGTWSSVFSYARVDLNGTIALEKTIDSLIKAGQIQGAGYNEPKPYPRQR